MEDSIFLQSFFSIMIKPTTLERHPFVKKRVIPALEKAHPKSIALLKQKVKKQLEGMSQEKVDEILWSRVLSEAINLTFKQFGEDRGLAFGLMGTSLNHQVMLWDGLRQSLYPTEKFSFSIPLLNKNTARYLSGDEDGEVYLRGSHSTANREGVAYSVIRIYFYVHDSSERRDVDATTISDNVGLLCEIPYFFIRGDHHETLADNEVTTGLFELFEIEKDDSLNWQPPDFIPTDELGDMTHFGGRVAIGNEFVTFHIS